MKYANTTAKIWSDLKERFGKESAPRVYELKQTLSATIQGNTFVSPYFTKLRSIWDEMQSTLPIPRCNCNWCSCDVGKKLVEHREKERLYEFLMGLNSEFSVIRTQILAMNPTRTLGNAYHLVAENEKQRSITADKRDSADAVVFEVFVPGHRKNGSSQRRDKPLPRMWSLEMSLSTTPCVGKTDTLEMGISSG